VTRCWRTDRAGGRTTTIAYDANHNIVSLGSPRRPAHQFRYNALDFLTASAPATVPNGGETVTSYNLARQITDVVLPGGGRVEPKVQWSPLAELLRLGIVLPKLFPEPPRRNDLNRQLPCQLE
jgi:YD repeat-containing protein